MTLKEKFEWVTQYFLKNMPDAQTELDYRNDYELIVAVILSAQCTDKRVNLVTPMLFSEFPNYETLAAAKAEEIFEQIKSISYPNNKSKHLSGMAKMVISEFEGILPNDVTMLQKLPGVGRKTANVVVSVLYNAPAMAVDTHVFRVAHRLGLVKNAKTPEKVETQLVKYFDDAHIARAHHWLILHGRYVCLARTPSCNKCGIKEVCNHYNKIIKKDS